jgi:hypothetical protein
MIEHPAKPSRRRLIVGIVIGLIIVGLIVVALDWHEVKKILGETDWKLVPVALLFTAISYTCLSFGFATANRIFGIRLRWRDLSEIGFVSIVLNHLISAGGAAGYSVRFLLMGDQGASVRDILAASLFNSYLDSMGMLALLPVGMGYLFIKHPLGPGMTVVVGISTVLLVLLFFLGTALVFVRRLRTAVLRAIGRLGRFVTHRDLQPTLHDFDETMTRAIAVLHTRPQLLFLMIALVIFDWTASVAALWFCFDALGDPISLGVLLTGFTLSITAGAVSMVPGGLGIQDGSMAGLYALLGVPLHNAVLASILFRLVYYLVPYLVSLIFYGRLLRQVGHTGTPMQVVEER